MERKVIVVVGPTASGKSEAAFEIAQFLKSEIISADSRQFYREMTIGTAKPHEYWLKTVPHHFVNNLSISEEYNVFQFRVQAKEIIKRLHKEKKIPVVVGGSGLYIRALVKGIIEHEEIDPEIKENISTKKKLFGKEFLYDELKKVDPKSASEMLPQNWKRVVRALEVFHQTGKTISQHFDEQKNEDENRYFQFELEWERKKLYERIDARVDDMIKSGLAEEVKFLKEKFGEKNLNALNTVGYRELFQYLNDEIDLMEAIRLIKRNTRHFAKRQITWFKKDSSIRRIQCDESISPKEIARQILNNLN